MQHSNSFFWNANLAGDVSLRINSFLFSLKWMNKFILLTLLHLIKLVYKNHYYLHCNTSAENNFSIHFQSIKLNYNCSLTNTSFNFISIPFPCILRILYIHVICTLQFKYSTWFWFFMIFLYLSWNGTNEKVGIGMCYKHEFSLFFFSPARVSSSYCSYIC